MDQETQCMFLEITYKSAPVRGNGRGDEEMEGGWILQRFFAEYLFQGRA